MKIGVLAIQGSFVEHISMLQSIGAEAVEVRLPNDLKDLGGLIIPGGESTTIGKLAVKFDLLDPLRDFALSKPVWGTCAGMILLAKDVGIEQPTLGVMDIAIERNAFGRQIDSFEADIYVSVLDNGKSKPFPAVFIRAPKMVKTGSGVKIIARLADETPVAALQGKMLVTSFHPELSEDTRFHRFFLNLV
ncbi:pyridoxal 5'-phosphate synthase glutaminase subunit PdxT [Thermodesulfobacteriota bacterium]